MLDVLRQTAEDLAETAASSLASLSDVDLVDCLRAAHRAEQAAVTMKARLVQQVAARGLPAEQRFRSMAGWLQSTLVIDPRPARELADQADIMRTRPAVEQALIDGALDIRQAVAVAEAVNAIPETLEAMAEDYPDQAIWPGSAAAENIADQAERFLLDMADRFPARQLQRAGERILAHVAPEIADLADEAALRRQEARAHDRRFFTLHPPVDGKVRVSGSLSVEDAAIISAALHPLCKPVARDTRSPGQIRADALVDVCRLALRTRDLPRDGGEPAQVTVTVKFDPLTGELGTGDLDTGERVSAETVRRMACDAKILPVVLGGAGQVLDAGRSRRLATGPLRRALVVRDRGCAFPDCDRPARWCDAHHLRGWADGGTTRLGNLVLLCGHHHRVLHDPDSGWTVRIATDGLPEFIPPRWIDVDRKPRRNLFHLRT